MVPDPSSGGPTGQACPTSAARRVHLLTIAAILVIATALGATLLLLANPPEPAAPTSNAAIRPAVMLWAKPSWGSGTLADGGISGAPAHFVITGRVLALTGRTITIGGPGFVVTARLAGATAGNGQAIRAVRVGETVTARIERLRSGAVVTAAYESLWIP